MEGTIEQFILEYQEHLDDTEWLSKSIVHLSTLLFELNKRMAQAELDEARAVVGYLGFTSREGKRMPVSEAEKKAVVETGGAGHLLKGSIEAIKEIIGAIKTRLGILDTKVHE